MPKTYVDFVLVYLLLFVSGSLIYEQSSDKLLVLVFIIAVAAWLLYSDRSLNNRFVLYVCSFSGFLLLIHFYTGASLPLSSVIGTTMKMLMAYLVVRTVDSRFVDTYIRVITFLAAVSLFGYISDVYGLFNGLITRLPQVVDFGYEGIFYLFRFWVQIDRNCSIFFEPGAYQAFLNAGLFLLFFVKTGFTAFRRLFYIIILLVTLLTTYSTTGFLIFGVMFVLFLLKSTMFSTKAKTVLVAVLIIMVGVFAAQFQHVIFEKIETFLAVEAVTDSRDRRSFDLLVDLEIFKKHIFGLGYVDYGRAFSAIGKISEGHGSSNGITKSLAVYGLPFTVFLFGSYYFAFRRLVGPGIMALAAFVMFLMFMVGEAYYLMVPYTLAVIGGAFVYERPKEISA